MDQIKFGKFISSLRNEQHLTQEQLAEKLHVGSKTISKWECGNTIPDFETLISISQEFDISLYELSACEKIKDKSITKNDILKIVDKKHLNRIRLRKKMILISIIFLIFISLISMIYTITNFNTTKIYTIESLDKNFTIHGTYTKTKEYSVFSITKVDYIGENYNLAETKVSNYEYEIFNDKTRIYSYEQSNPKTTDVIANEIFSKINILIDSKTHNTQLINDDDLKLSISYLDKENKNQNNKIEIQLKLIENYVNNQLY